MRNAEGIGIYSNEPLNFSLIPYDQKKVKEIIYDHWQSFLRLISTGPFFNLLPISLKKKEVLSQIDYEGIVSNVVGMRNRTVIPISGRLF